MEKNTETMETKEKTAVKSTRARVSSIQKFDKLADDFNLTQADLYDIAVEAAEAKLLKEKVPGRADEIDALETTLTQIRKFYYSSIEMAALAKSTAEKELKVELETRTRTISDLQEKQDVLKERIETLEQGLDAATTENLKLQQEVENLTKTIADKDALIQSLKNSAAAVDAVGAFAELKELVANLKKDSTERKEPEKE